jgi:hypothetical protein
MEAWIEFDADQAVRKVYDEYLQEHIKDGPKQAHQRLQRLRDFDNRQVVSTDHLNAIKAARDAYTREIGAGATEIKATDVARDALYGEFDRQRIMQKEVDRDLYRKNPEYCIRTDKKIAEQIEENRQGREQKRQEQLETALPGPAAPQAVLETQVRQEQLQRGAAAVQEVLATEAAVNAERVSRDGQFRQAAEDAGIDRRPPKEFNIVAEEIRIAWRSSKDAPAFAAALAEEGLHVACVTKDDARASAIEEARAQREGRYAPALREAEYVVVTEQAEICRLTPRMTGESFRDTQEFMASLDPKTVLGVEATKQRMQDLADTREIERQAFRDLSAVGLLKRQDDAPNRDRENERDASIDSFKARNKERQEEKEHSKIDPARFRSDPEYRREIKAREKEKLGLEQRRELELDRVFGPQL